MERLAARLQLKEFRLIHAIEQTGQLTLAAEQLAITQPAASRMLAQIERTIGSNIFMRHPKGMTPTAVGAVLARNAATLIRSIERTADEVEATGAGRAGTVRVGAVTGGAVAFVVPAIQQLKRDADGADIHVDVATSDALMEGMLRGDYDFVLSRVPPGIDARQFNIRRGRVEIIRFLVRAGHPLESASALSLAELAGYQWIIQAPRSPMRQAVEDAFIHCGVPLPSEIVNTTSLLVMLSYLSASDAVAPISGEVADLFGPTSIGGNVRVLDINEPIIVHAYHMVTLKNQVLNPIAVKLRNLVLEQLSTAGA